MSTEVNWQTQSASSAETERVAEQIGRKLQGGEVIELISDLGGGKTTFVRGLARGTGSQDTVASPTFTISKVYAAPSFAIHHFDFYRLPDAGIVGNELAEVINDPKIVTVVEWADVVGHVLPEDRLTIRIDQTPEGARQLHVAVPAERAYLLPLRDVVTNRPAADAEDPVC